MTEVIERRNAEEAARESDGEDSPLIQSASEAILVVQDGVVAFANPASLEMIGSAESEVIGRSILDFVHPEQQEAVLVLQKRLLNGELRLGMNEYRVVTTKGLELWLRAGTVAISWKGAPATMYSASDVTETKRAELMLRRSMSEMRSMNAELERRVAEQTAELEAFSYTVAHDLKSPLRACDGFAAIVLENEGGHLTEEGRQMLGRIRAESQRGGRLIEDLLRLSRLSKINLHVSRIEVSSLAARVAERIQSLEPERRVDWVIEPGLSADADGRLIEEVLEELFGNAWKFTRRKEDVRIEFGATDKSGKRAFFVRDNGAGFDNAHAGQLFGAFHRVHTDREFPGLGIGLAVVAKIVHRHGGTTWAEGELCKSATIYFTL